MKLQRLVEMLGEDRNGAENWPVFFTGFTQDSSRNWQEVDSTRGAITAVEVDADAKEVLLIQGSDSPALSVASLQQELARLLPCCSDFDVDSCETPIKVDEGWIRIDLPVCGAGRDEKNQCYLVVVTSRKK